MYYSNDKELSKRIAKLVELGWTYEFNGKHGKLKCPDANVIVWASRTPSGKQACHMFERDVRRKLKEVGLPSPFH